MILSDGEFHGRLFNPLAIEVALVSFGKGDRAVPDEKSLLVTKAELDIDFSSI